MDLNLPKVIFDYVNASNAHDPESILSCFADTATVYDEGQRLDGKKSIEEWIVKTIARYKFHFQTLSVRSKDAEVVVAVKVSGTFDGSPVTLDYHFAIEDGKITSLAVR